MSPVNALSINNEFGMNVVVMEKHPVPNQLSAKEFNHKFTWLIILAWTVPAVFGLLFILYIKILSPEQLIGILLTPTEPAFIIIWVAFAAWYFRKYISPVSKSIATGHKDSEATRAALACMQGFPFRFWSLFLVYLLLAPASVILSAEYFTDYVAQPVDWFRINLVALIVSIIVGLPLFFMLLDLFGKSLQGIQIKQPHITIKAKVFMIGALVPLLIDTMLVQYYWTRTGFFTTETFMVWLFLEVLAIVGSLIFTRSFAQSLSPLQQISHINKSDPSSAEKLFPCSTDELGVLTTDYRALLDDLYKHQENLETLVAERTSELKAANEELEAFNASIAHDLHAPINAISNYCQIMHSEFAEELGSTGKDSLSFINETALNMSKLIDDMLQMSRVSQVDLEREEVNLSLIAEEILQKLSSMYPERDIEFIIETDLTCYADRDEMIILMDNLLSNAWKYTSKKAAASIEFGKIHNENDDCFYVKDNGAGFNMEDIGKLFVPFKRLHKNSEFLGTGIGLTTVDRIVRKHSGRIWAEAEVNKGATFFINIPAHY